MLKFRCNQCGQTVAVVDPSAGDRVKCPRCGAENDPSKPAATEPPSVDEAELVSDMLESEAEAQVRREAREKEEAARRDAERERELERVHNLSQRISRLGRSGVGGAGKSGLIGGFIGTAVLILLLVWGVRALMNAAPDGMPFAIGAKETSIEELVDHWVRSLGGDLRREGVTYHVYHVNIAEKTPQGDALTIVRGDMRAADRPLSKEQVASRLKNELTDDMDSLRVDRKDKNELLQGVKKIRNTYDPKRIQDTASMRSALGRIDRAPADSGGADLQAMGFEFDEDPTSSGSSPARRAEDLVRSFTCVVRKDETTRELPAGRALEYFIWDAQASAGAVKLLRGAALNEIKTSVDEIFGSLQQQTAGYKRHAMVYGTRTLDELFPDYYRPQKWVLARCDIRAQGRVRAFVIVHDREVSRSGTWILTYLNLEADRQWRVSKTWHPRRPGS